MPEFNKLHLGVHKKDGWSDPEPHWKYLSMEDPASRMGCCPEICRGEYVYVLYCEWGTRRSDMGSVTAEWCEEALQYLLAKEVLDA